MDESNSIDSSIWKSYHHLFIAYLKLAIDHLTSIPDSNLSFLPIQRFESGIHFMNCNRANAFKTEVVVCLPLCDSIQTSRLMSNSSPVPI